MDKPLIILGAGASFDYIPEEEATRKERFKAPLTNELFKHDKTETVMDSLPNNELLSDLAGSINSRLRNQTGDNQQSLETILADLISKGSHRKSQIIAFSFYLQKLFQTISDEYGRQRGNNLNALKGHIEDNGGEATIISFNYDLFLEQVFLTNIRRDIDDYIEGRIKLIKVHGSCDWIHPFGINPPGTDATDQMSSYKFLIKEPEYIERKGLGDIEKDFIIGRSYARNGENLFFPAIALPLAKKEDHYVCPTKHIEVLEEELKETKKILVIGWRAADPYILDLIAKHIQEKEISITIVAGKLSSAKEVETTIKSTISNAIINATHHTFSSFIGSSDADEFFSNK